MYASPSVTLFLTGAVLGFSAAAQPGPFQAYLLAQSAKNGAARTMPVALVPFVSDPIVIAVVLAILSALRLRETFGVDLDYVEAD